MRRVTQWSLLLAAIAATALASTGSGSAAAAKTVNGTVGPGFTIGLTMQSKQVTRLKAGVSYRFVISDRSSDHNFHLTGPRLNRELTAVGYTGTRELPPEAAEGDTTASSATRTPTSCAAASWSLTLDLRGGGRGPRLRSSARADGPAISPIAASAEKDRGVATVRTRDRRLHHRHRHA